MRNIKERNCAPNPFAENFNTSSEEEEEEPIFIRLHSPHIRSLRRDQSSSNA